MKLKLTKTQRKQLRKVQESKRVRTEDLSTRGYAKVMGLVNSVILKPEGK
jgi:hypothetical protein